MITIEKQKQADIKMMPVCFICCIEVILQYTAPTFEHC